jgi:glucose-6-phosphate 1-dehydrogenase
MTASTIAPATTNAPLCLLPYSAPAGPCTLVIFGASGDLTKRKLFPALYNLAANKLLPENFAIVGVARRDKSDEDFRKEMTEAIKEFATRKVDDGDEVWNWFLERTYYLSGSFEEQSTYEHLKSELAELDKKHNTAGNYLFYLATSEDYFEPIIESLNKQGLNAEEDNKWRHVIIEKPFGRDFESANELNKHILSVLKEKQVYRIDHYLGKETVQNIMLVRFSNGFFEPAWNNRYIDSVQITVAESVGVEGGRGGFYEKAGALRDMLPNHLFQLVSMIAMEPPTCFDADAVRDRKTELMSAIRPFTHDDVRKYAVRGQYGDGKINGKPVSGYRCEDRVAKDSPVETFVALKLEIDNWRWAGVPFYLRTGKALHSRATEIAIQFKQPPFSLFRNTEVNSLTPNYLIMHIQPDEGISLQFGAKLPGPSVQIAQVEMDFKYKDYFGAPASTGYETLIYDCMIGDPTLFNRADNVEAGWKVVKPIQEVWLNEKPKDFPNYAAGSWGPQDSIDLLARDGRMWRMC